MMMSFVRQREVIYGQRQDILETEDLTDIIFGMVESSVTRFSSNIFFSR